MDLELAGKHCFVTGASAGIGRAAAVALAAEGARMPPMKIMPVSQITASR
jgi:NADP-dependent 3-hydroxy acid dehydrogenase YdfG